MRVANSQSATASIRLDVTRKVTTLPNTVAASNAVIGLLDTSTTMPICIDQIGKNNQLLELAIRDAPGSSLRVDCPLASTMTIENTNGRCLQAVWTDAERINTVGNRSMVIYHQPRAPTALPTVIDISGMTSWGLPVQPASTNTNTRVIVRLSQWQQDQASASQLEIEGQLPYNVPQRGQAGGVIVFGCGANRVRCTATDKSGFPACKIINSCVPSAATAKANLLAAINSPTPCAPPS